MHFVNAIVPFEDFGLPKISDICKNTSCVHPHEDQKVEAFFLDKSSKDNEKDV
jgi:hypothetical protein